MQIAELKTAANQIPIVDPGLYAIVAKVLDRKTGNGNYGDWSMQGLELKDNTGSIQAVIWNKPDLAPLLGKEIHLSAVNEGDGWKGCSVEDRSYTTKDGANKKVRQIKASGKFLLEECQPTARPVVPGQPGYPKGNDPALNPSEQAPEQAPGQPQAQLQRVSLPNWDEYIAVVRSAHHLALELEPDVSPPGSYSVDRGRARVALVATILIAYGKRDFSFEAPEQDPNHIPF